MCVRLCAPEALPPSPSCSCGGGGVAEFCVGAGARVPRKPFALPVVCLVLLLPHGVPVAAECSWGVAPREWHYCCLLLLPWSVLDVLPLPHQCLVVLVWLGCGSVVGVVSRGWHCCRSLPLCPHTVPAGNCPPLRCLALACHTRVVPQNRNSSELSNAHVFFYLFSYFVSRTSEILSNEFS